MKSFFKWAYLSVLICTSKLCLAEVTVLYEQNFDANSLLKTVVANFEAVDNTASLIVSRDAQLNYQGSSGSIKASYPAPVGSGGYYVWAGFTPVQRDLNDIYIEFWAKMPGHKHGLKFLKVFGQSSESTGYANTTFGLDYTGVNNGGMYCVSFGDGTNLGNDTANLIMFNGEYPKIIGRSYGKASVLLPQRSMWNASNWGTGWHRFRFHVKFNSGTSPETEVADGEYYVEIDGKVYVNAKGIFNRHYLNKPIDRIEFFGWSQSGNTPFEIWYDNIVITTGGFVNGLKLPAPPVDPKIEDN